MTADQPLSEYLKTCSDREYAEYIISTMCGKNPQEWDTAKKEAIEAIRSRPLASHTPSPDIIPLIDKQGDAISRLENDLVGLKECIEKHDAAIARSTTIALREEFNKINDTRTCPETCENILHCCDVEKCGLCIFDKAVDSLRAGIEQHDAVIRKETMKKCESCIWEEGLQLPDIITKSRLSAAKDEREKVLNSAIIEVELALNKVEVRKLQAEWNLVDAAEMIQKAEKALESLRAGDE